jgi:hypothetical protein
MNAAALRGASEFAIDGFDRTRDLASVEAIHRNYSGRVNVTAVRDSRDWLGNLAFAGNQPIHPGEGSSEYFILARDEAGIAAYARVTRFHGVTMVMEYGYRDGGEDGMVTLLRHLGEIAAGARSSHRLLGDHRRAALLTESSGSTAPAGVLITHSAHDQALEKRLVTAGASITYHKDNNYMWRVISPEKLGQRLGLPAAKASERAFELFADDRSLFWTSDRF